MRNPTHSVFGLVDTAYNLLILFLYSEKIRYLIKYFTFKACILKGVSVVNLVLKLILRIDSIIERLLKLDSLMLN